MLGERWRQILDWSQFDVFWQKGSGIYKILVGFAKILCQVLVVTLDIGDRCLACFILDVKKFRI